MEAIHSRQACVQASGSAQRGGRRPAPARRSAQHKARASCRRRGAGCLQRAAAQENVSTAPSDTIDWDSLGFSITNVAPFMFKATCRVHDPEAWVGGIEPYGPLEMMPSAQVLNYGQAIFEGMKAQRSQKGNIVLFRPEKNAARMAGGAGRMSMQPIPEDVFVSAVESVVKANAAFVPPAGKGALYLRPLLLGSAPILGLGPSEEFTFVVFAAPVGSYFKGGQLAPIDLVVESRFHRSAPKGMGGTKAAGNYSPVLVTQLAAKKQGYADVIYLDARHEKYLEEVSSCNIFVVKGNTIKTPPTSGSILPGVTRASICELAKSLGFEVLEEAVSIDEALDADEIFTTGTAVVVSSVGSITHEGNKVEYCDGKVGPVTMQMYDRLTGIQSERYEDEFGWVRCVIENA
ncbi:unnamed protein product [Pedinophyceae sp. YPF-701]|nr:unnamed protein product [Pedinophyceae sp. YPF-701]